MQARDLSKFVQAAYGLIPYFIFSPQEGNSFQAMTLFLVSNKYENCGSFLRYWYVPLNITCGLTQTSFLLMKKSY